MTIAASLVAAIAVAVAAWGLLIGSTDHSCHAPCVVKFDQPMAEDEFKLDYRHGGTVKVWRSQP